MAILSKRTMTEVIRTHYQQGGVRACFMDLAGRVTYGDDELSGIPIIRRKRSYALQESINRGGPYGFEAAPGVMSCMVALEDRRMIHGGAIAGHAFVEGEGARWGAVDYLVSHGMEREHAGRFVERLPAQSESWLQEAGRGLEELFYGVSGWRAELMKENRLKAQQQEQINQAIEDQRRRGKQALYAFDKERALLANIRAGDSSGARRILNEMLAAIYMSSPGLVVLRARAVELMTCLTRAAIEDNPLLEPLIERNHAWTERLVAAKDFEGLSRVLMEALDDFMEGIYLHGVNRSNMKVRKALDHIGRHYMKRRRLADVAREAGVSVSRLSHLVKECTGRTVLQISDEIRIRHSQRLLENTSKSCTDIAYEVGFGDQSYFIRRFKRITGTTPARYRRSRNAGRAAPGGGGQRSRSGR